MSKLSLYLSGILLAFASSARLDHLTPQNYAGGRPSNDVPYKYENVNDGDGNYRFSYDTPDGISAHESGSPRAQGPEGPAVTAEGGFSYRAPDGQQISLTYVADENGFQPQGSHLPTPPPIPDAILKSLEFNRQNPEAGPGAGAGRNRY